MSQSSVGYQDIIYNTIDTLINERMSQLSIDNILTGIITDESRKDQGIYKVKSNNVTYEVQGENNAYKKDAIVQFSVPKDDGIRVIIGECRGFNEKPLTYLSLTDQFIPSWEYEDSIEETKPEIMPVTIPVDRTYSNYYNALYFKGNVANKSDNTNHYAINFIIYIEEKSYAFQYSSKDMIGNPLGTTASFMREALFPLNDLPVGRITKISCEALNCNVSNFVVQLGFMAASKNNGTVEIHCLNAADESSFKGPAYIYKGGVDEIFYSKNQTLDSDGRPIADFTEAKYDEGGKPSFDGKNSFDHDTLKRSFELIYYNRNEDGKYIGFGEEGYRDNKAAQLKSNFMPEPSATGYSSGTDESNDLVIYSNLPSSKRLEPSSRVKRENATLKKMQLIYDLKEIIDLPEIYKLQLIGTLNSGKSHGLSIKLSNGNDDPIELLDETFEEEDRPSFTIIKNIKIDDNKNLSIEKSSEGNEEVEQPLNLNNTLNLIFEVTKPEAQDLNTNISLALSTLSIGVAQPVYSILWETNAYDGTWAPLIIEEGTPLKPVFRLNPALPQNQFRAKLYSGSDIPTESNTITFYQTDYNGEALKMPSNIKISIEHGEDSRSKNNYPFYDDYMQLINPAESTWNRQVILNLEGLEGYTIDLKTFLKGCKIYWGIPKNASMLLVGENISYSEIKENESLPKLASDKYTYYYDNRYVNNTYVSGAISGFNYRIQSIYQPQHINNSIHCILVDTNGFEYQTTIAFGFSARGNHGTDYTLIVKEQHGYLAYVPGEDGTKDYTLVAELYSPDGTKNEATITWDKNEFITDNITRTVRTATATITNKGRQVTLSKDFPIPYATYSQYIYQGPVHIVYDMTGANPQYWDGAIRILNTLTENAQPTPYICKIGTNGWKVLEKYEGYYLEPVDIKDSTKGIKLIVPPTFYERNDLAIVIMSGPGLNPTLEEEQIRWVQPLIIRQQRHYYDVLNQWNGNLTIDEEGNRIMAAAYAAGRMEGDNSFTGVITGEKGKFVDNKKQIETGIFGYNEGAETFALRADGTFDLRGTDANSNTEISLNSTGKLNIKQVSSGQDMWSYVESTAEKYVREMGEIETPWDTSHLKFKIEYKRNTLEELRQVTDIKNLVIYPTYGEWIETKNENGKEIQVSHFYLWQTWKNTDENSDTYDTYWHPKKGISHDEGKYELKSYNNLDELKNTADPLTYVDDDINQTKYDNYIWGLEENSGKLYWYKDGNWQTRDKPLYQLQTKTTYYTSKIEQTAGEIKSVVDATTTKFDIEPLIKGYRLIHNINDSDWAPWVGNGKIIKENEEEYLYGTPADDYTSSQLYISNLTGEIFWVDRNPVWSYGQYKLKYLSNYWNAPEGQGGEIGITKTAIRLWRGMGHETKTNYDYLIEQSLPKDTEGANGDIKLILYNNVYSLYYKTFGKWKKQFEIGNKNPGQIILPSTTIRQSSQISQQPDNITLSVTNGEESSILSIKAGNTTLSSQEITLSGMVTFKDLNGTGSKTTTINGNLITTGTITSDKKVGDSSVPAFMIDLDNGLIEAETLTIRSGIGGQNLVPGSSRGDMTQGFQVGYATSQPVYPYGNGEPIYCIDMTNYWTSLLWKIGDQLKKKWITISGEILTPNDLTLKGQIWAGAGLNDNDEDKAQQNSDGLEIKGSSTFQPFKISFLNKTSLPWVGLYIHNPSNTGSIQIKYLKIELGSQKTAWTMNEIDNSLYSGYQNLIKNNALKTDKEWYQAINPKKNEKPTVKATIEAKRYEGRDSIHTKSLEAIPSNPPDKDPYCWIIQTILFEDLKKNYLLQINPGIDSFTFTCDVYIPETPGTVSLTIWADNADSEWDGGKNVIYSELGKGWHTLSITRKIPYKVMNSGVDKGEPNAIVIGMLATNTKQYFSNPILTLGRIQPIANNLKQDNMLSALANGYTKDGIYSENGKLVINATAIKTGLLASKNWTSSIISDGKTGSAFDLDNGYFVLNQENNYFKFLSTGLEIKANSIALDGAYFSITPEDGLILISNKKDKNDQPLNKTLMAINQDSLLLQTEDFNVSYQNTQTSSVDYYYKIITSGGSSGTWGYYTKLKSDGSWVDSSSRKTLPLTAKLRAETNSQGTVQWAVDGGKDTSKIYKVRDYGGYDLIYVVKKQEGLGINWTVTGNVLSQTTVQGGTNISITGSQLDLKRGKLILSHPYDPNSYYFQTPAMMIDGAGWIKYKYKDIWYFLDKREDGTAYFRQEK